MLCFDVLPLCCIERTRWKGVAESKTKEIINKESGAYETRYLQLGTKTGVPVGKQLTHYEARVTPQIA